jgi:magnesium transporter
MIRVFYISSGKLASSSLEDLKNNTNLAWIDCIDPSENELCQLSGKTGIPVDDFNQVIGDKERPGLNDFDNYAVITFHSPYQGKSYTTVPFSLFICKKTLIVLRKKPIEAIDRLELLSPEKKLDFLQKDITYLVYMILSEVIDHFYRISDEFAEQADNIEEEIMKNNNQKVVREIFALKRSLIYYHKSLTGNREVIIGIQKQYLKQLNGVHLKKFSYIYNDVIQLIDMLLNYRDLLTSSLEIYVTTISNNLNEVVKRLTIIASFLLGPSLIASIYGMNFTFMPEIHVLREYGYPFAIALMALSVIVIYVYFKRKRWI